MVLCNVQSACLRGLGATGRPNQTLIRAELYAYSTVMYHDR